jgi:hypothetical protein
MNEPIQFALSLSFACSTFARFVVNAAHVLRFLPCSMFEQSTFTELATFCRLNFFFFCCSCYERDPFNSFQQQHYHHCRHHPCPALSPCCSTIITTAITTTTTTTPLIQLQSLAGGYN